MQGRQDFFKVENNSLELTRIFQNIFIDPIVSVRKKAEKRGRHEERERKKERDVSASTPSSVTEDRIWGIIRTGSWC